MTFNDAADSVFAVLQQHYADMVDNVDGQEATDLAAIAEDAATYGISYAAKESNAEANLRYVEASIKLLASKVLTRENRHIGETLLLVTTIAARAIGQIVLRVPIG